MVARLHRFSTSETVARARRRRTGTSRRAPHRRYEQPHRDQGAGTQQLEGAEVDSLPGDGTLDRGAILLANVGGSTRGVELF